MFVLDLLKMMLADFGVSLWTWFCIYGKVLNYQYCYYVHGKLTHASFWCTCHVICAGTPNLFDTLHRYVSFYLSIILGTNDEKQQVHLLQYAFQFHHNCSFFVSHLSCQWNSFCIFQNALFLHVLAFFCHRPCFELTAATQLLNLVPKILSSDLVFLHRHTLTHRLMTATLLL